MTAKASVSWEWRWRLGLIALMGLGWGLYSLYDGLVAYPRHNEVRRVWDELAERNAEHEWKAVAQERGWSTEQPDPPKSNSDIMMQYVMAGLTLPLGLVFAFAFLRSQSRWIAMDERGIKTSWGEVAAFDTIQNLNKDRWKSKGIAIVGYEGDKGVGKIVLDDWKYTTEPIRQMVREVESHLRPEQITGGAPEPVAETTPSEPPVATDTAPDPERQG